MRKLVLTAFLLFSGAAAGAPTETPSDPRELEARRTLDEACAKALCRKMPWEYALRLPTGEMAKFKAPPYPYLYENGQLTILPGETVGLAVDAQDTGLGRPVLAAVSDPNGTVALSNTAKPTLTFSFVQMNGKPDMMLTVTNGTAVTVKYDAAMIVLSANGPRVIKTSSCPVLPPQGSAKEFAGIEHWPHPIIMLIVENIRALPKSSRAACD